MKQKNIDPSLWGPGGWHIMHRLSFTFTSATSAYDFYHTLKRLLPCAKCRLNYINHLSNLPFPSKATEIPRWVVRLHNLVNVAKEKPIHEWSLREMRNMYQKDETCEWIFVASLIDSHPGKNGITSEYVQDMHLFLCEWTKSIAITCPARTIIESKKELKKWLRKYYKISRHEKTCTSDQCEI